MSLENLPGEVQVRASEEAGLINPTEPHLQTPLLGVDLKLHEDGS